MFSVDKLSKCPHCGGDALFDCKDYGAVVWVECSECHARSRTARVSKTPTFTTQDDAYAFVYGAWERREDN